MGILSWILVGLLAGWLASLVIKTGTSSLLMDLLLGVVGAFVGGFIMKWLGYDGVTGFNLYSILVATLGAIVVVALVRLLRK